MIEAALYSILSADSGVAAIAGTRIYPLLAPDHVLPPFVTFQKITGVRLHALGAEHPLANPRVQIDCYDLSYLGAKTLAEAIRHALDHYLGTAAGVLIRSCLLENEIDFHEGTVTPPLERVALEFMIIHTES